MSDAERTVCAAPGVLSATIGTSLLLLDRSTNTTRILDPGTALVWSSTTTEPVTAADIASGIAADLGGTTEEHLPHVRATMDRLLEDELITDDHLTADWVSPDVRRPSQRDPGRSGSPLRQHVMRSFTSLPASHRYRLATGSHVTELVCADAELGPSLVSDLGILTTTSTQPTRHQLAVTRSARTGLPFRIHVDGALKHRATSPVELLRQVMFELNALARTTSGGALALHAGAVECDGRVLLIAGASGAGKSTLTAALVKQRYRYVTDEVAVVDLPSGRVSAFPKPIDLSADSWELIGAAQHQPDPVASDQKIPLTVDSIGIPSSGGHVVALLVLDTSTDGARPVDELEAKVLTVLANAFREAFDSPDAGSLLQATIEWAASLLVVRHGRGDLKAVTRCATTLLDN